MSSDTDLKPYADSLGISEADLAWRIFAGVAAYNELERQKQRKTKPTFSDFIHGLMAEAVLDSLKPPTTKENPNAD